MSGREVYREELTKLAMENEKILCLELDLGGKKHPFLNKHPERFFNLGIAEQAGIDIAAGLAESGYIPFISTFAAFASLRAAESIKLAMGYMAKNIKVVAPYGGVSGGWFGTTHHCLEDIAIINSFPGIKIACPHGELETQIVIREAVKSDKPYYIRLARNESFSSIFSDPQQSIDTVVFENNNQYKNELCLVSVGEKPTELCRNLLIRYTNLLHAHMCYVDLQSLKDSVKVLKNSGSKFLVFEEHREFGSVASMLSLLMPEKMVFSFNCGEKWPKFGGSHDDVLNELGFSIENARKQIEIICK